MVSEGKIHELEALMSSLAHDLDEPLRNLEHLLGKLEGDPHTQAVALGQARRARQLVEDLLHYARAGARKPELEAIDPSESVGWAIANLRKRIEDSSASIEMTPLPRVRADALFVARIFQNLIANAVRFCGSTSPWVRVSGERVGGEVVLCVADRGIGIAPEHHERIFRALERAHPGERSGSGLGLAICSKLVAMQDGRIWVESEEGRGARFFFTLPADPSRD